MIHGDGLRGGLAVPLFGVPLYKWCEDVTGMNDNVMLVHAGFSQVKNVSEKYPQSFRHTFSKIFICPLLG